jgi:hypothetical protein
MKEIKNQLLIQKIESYFLKKNLPLIQTGDTVKLNIKIQEGEKIRLQAEADMVSSFQIRRLGIWNIDKIMNNEDFVKCSLKFDFEKQIDPLVNHIKLFVLYEEDNSVVYYLPQDWDKVRLSKTKRSSLVAVLPNNKVAFVDPKRVNAKVNQGNSNIFFSTVEQPASLFK